MKLVSSLASFSSILILLECRLIESRRFQFQGPILTLTLKDPFEQERYQQQQQQQSNTNGANNNNDNSQSQLDPQSQSLPSNKSWWRRFQPEPQMRPLNIFNLPSLSPTILYGIRSLNPLPYYFPLLQSTSLTASYNYHDLKNAPNFIEGDMKLYSDKLHMDMDVGASYNVRQKLTAHSLRLGSLPSRPTSMAVTATVPSQSHGNGNDAYDPETQPQPSPRNPTTASAGGQGSILLQTILTKRKVCLSFLRAQYNLNLPPFTAQSISSITITPTYSFINPYEQSQCTIVAKSTSGRTASILDLNMEAPTLSVVHALDYRNTCTIQPEIGLLDAKIRYNFSKRLNERGGMVKIRVDPVEAVQVTWVDEAGDGGKWVTDFRLPLSTGNGGLNGGGNKQGKEWRSDIRVRRQFVF